MNPQEQFCHNSDCPDRGKVGAGNIGVHSSKDQRYICHTCGKTFSESKGTPLYKIKKDKDTFVKVTTLRAHGCPTQAIVAAFELDERTVAAWDERAGVHSQAIHEHVVGKSQLNLGQVQADEIKVKTQGGYFWMAMAMMVSTRLWLGGVVSQRRDKRLIKALMEMVRAVALCRPLMVAVDGLSSYVKATRNAFRTPLREGKVGRPRLISWRDVAIVQVVKRRSRKSLEVTRRIVQGSPQMIETLLQSSQGGGVINTAYIERLNATFRARISCLTRRGRALARTSNTLTYGMYLAACVYNFCTYHHSLRLPLYFVHLGQHRRWVQRTPAIAAGLTDHLWSVEELLTFKVPPLPYVPPKRRSRPRKQAILEVAA